MEDATRMHLASQSLDVRRYVLSRDYYFVAASAAGSPLESAMNFADLVREWSVFLQNPKFPFSISISSLQIMSR